MVSILKSNCINTVPTSMGVSKVSCGCIGPLPSTPQHQSSEYFQDVSGSFAVNAKAEHLMAHFSWLVELRKALPHAKVYLEAEFQDPSSMNGIPYKVPMMKLKGQTSE
jgi:hypothetical protein